MIHLGHFIEQVPFWFMPLVVLTMLVFPFFVWTRRHRAKRRYYNDPSNESGPIQGTLEELNAVDPKASPWINDERIRILDLHELAERYQMERGYSQTYMEDLENYLRKHGVESRVLFQSGLPRGIGPSNIERHGTFEFYILREQFEQGLALINEFKQKT